MSIFTNEINFVQNIDFLQTKLHSPSALEQRTQTLENQIVSQTNEIDSLKEDIKQKMEEFQTSYSISRQENAKLETELESKTVEFSDTIIFFSSNSKLCCSSLISGVFIGIS